MAITPLPDQNTKAVWATMVASWLVTKGAVVLCAGWAPICPFLTPDVVAAVVGIVAGLASHFVPMKTQEILDLAASVKLEAPDSPKPN